MQTNMLDFFSQSQSITLKRKAKCKVHKSEPCEISIVRPSNFESDADNSSHLVAERSKRDLCEAGPDAVPEVSGRSEDPKKKRLTKNNCSIEQAEEAEKVT